MSNNCAVALCNNYRRKIPDVLYHRFPRNLAFQKEWVVRCKRFHPFNISNARVCSRHFRPEDYERDLKNELLGLPQRRKLKHDAVPSVDIPNWHGDRSAVTTEQREEDSNIEQQQKTSRRSQRYQNRQVRKRALMKIRKLSLIEKSENHPSTTIISSTEKSDNHSSTILSPIAKIDNHSSTTISHIITGNQQCSLIPIVESHEIIDKDQEIQMLKKTIVMLRHKDARRKDQLVAAMKKANEMKRIAEKAIESVAKLKKRKIQEEFDAVVKKYFTEVKLETL